MLVHASPPRSLTNSETVLSAGKYVVIIAYPKLFRTAYSDAVMAITGLTRVEATTLTQCEAVIEQGLAGFVKVGEALLRIHNERLYRGTHRTFKAYCRKRWGWSRTHAYRQIDAAEVAENLSPTGDIPNLSPVGDIAQQVAENLTPIGVIVRNLGAMAPKPENERQTRPLVGLPPDRCRAGGGKF